MRKAYMGEKEKAKMREAAKKGDREKQKVVLASALVIKGEELVMAPMGDYRAVVGRDSVALQLSRSTPGATRRWSRLENTFQVMKHQEAVNLVWHIKDPQEAAECSAKEAVMRMSRGGNISCLVIRFDPYYIMQLLSPESPPLRLLF